MKGYLVLLILCTRFLCTASEGCSLSISFGSTSHGVDHKKADSMRAVLRAHASNLKVDSLHWGREGEVDFCINFKCMRKKRKRQIIEQIKGTLANGSNIYIEENKPILHH